MAETSPQVEGTSSASTHTIEDVLAAFRAGDRFLIAAHARPDGDSIGSMLACSMLLTAMGKQFALVSADRVPPLYEFLPGSCSIQHRRAIEPSEIYDAVLLLECDGIARSRLQGLAERPIVNIDHHASGRAFAAVNWIDSGASSLGEMIYRLAQAARVPVTAEMAICLYTALLTDTGAFCYQPTNARTFALAQELAERGADPAAIAAQVYFSNPASKMRLLGSALASLQIEDHIASISISCDEMARAGASDEDCEGLVNYAIGIAGVYAAVFLRELGSGGVRASLRSKESAASAAVNVAAIAERFGGGGHQHASGCALPGPLADARAKLVALLREASPAHELS